MLVGTDTGARDAMAVPRERAGSIGLRFQGIKPRREAPGLRLAVAAGRYRAPGALALRQVVPGGAGAEQPHQAVKEVAGVGG